ncbi:91L [Yaba monkey tumor virus]|uniref:Viral late gene transcription factor 2 n=1 Tax=Yaba monkey tumor virus (strain VR587) TaxID=928314 RepID=Q6TUS7_YMTV5|nr:late transcription factor VLTF-2 [Yaba monkey tumor virus]AAR07447.1 91L [Yaba monkey tumor virus]
MAKKVSLQNIVISSPKSVVKTVKEEEMSSILPKYYRSVAEVTLSLNTNTDRCWFCYQNLVMKPHYFVETLKGGKVGVFCSSICRDSFSSIIKSHVAIREEPKITLLPLVFYKDPEKVVNIINTLKNKEGIYGSCFYKENDKSIQISLRSLF